MWSRKLLSGRKLGLSIRSTSKIAVEITADVQRQFENAEIKPQHHPGRCKTGNIIVPPYVIKAVTRSIGDYPIKTLLREAETMNKHLQTRQCPPEEIQVQRIMTQIKDEIKENDESTQDLFKPVEITDLSSSEKDEMRSVQTRKIQKTMKERVYAWRPMSYGHLESLLYALVRGSIDYTILTKILMEIVKRDPSFKPRSYFDFGSGVGSGMWAASQLWKDEIFEYFNVDSSRDMNELSDMILREGIDNKESLLKHVYYRQFLPASEIKYNLVVASFSLLELPSSKARKDVIMNLWKKCDGYLILVEQGTRAGFELIEEARQHLLKQNDAALKGHVFSPCPHDIRCPRKANSNDRTPCNFEIQYDTLPVGQLSTKRTSLYSYVVLKKGERNTADETNEWPRIVRETLVRKKHSICRLCTSDGRLQEVIFTASKHGKLPYKCAKNSKWGDRLPVKVGEEFKNKEDSNATSGQSEAESSDEHIVKPNDVDTKKSTLKLD